MILLLLLPIYNMTCFILCSKISLIHVLLHYSIFINTSELKQCSFISMENFEDFFFGTYPITYQVSIHGEKMLCTSTGILFCADPNDNIEKLYELLKIEKRHQHFPLLISVICFHSYEFFQMKYGFQ